MASASNRLPELLPALHALSRADKLRVIQQLASDLASEESAPPLDSATPYPFWTPQHAFEAAAVLLKVLEAEGKAP